MALGILVLITALCISAVAIYYSIAGLVAIFAAAALPIMIMGGALEVGKLVTAVWLHRYWKQATWWLKTYLTTAVVVLMFITSMGIFGFLSKAHIEQTSASTESVAQVERLTVEIARQNGIIERAEQQITKLETSGTGNDANVQAQIDKEQERIDNAYTRIQPAIDEQQSIIDSQGQLYKDELARIDEQLATLQRYIDAGDKESIKKAQAMIGARQDGSWGSRTAAAAEEWRKGRQQARADLLTKIEAATNNPQARAARTEIQRLRQTAESQISESNKLINRLRSQIGETDKAADIDSQVDEQNLRIKNANAEIDKLTEEKYGLEAEYRKLEAEVGPIKYIAEFVYGETADNNMLEEAVRWVIITIIFVFDPLAVLLLIASQYTFAFNRKDDDGERLRLEREEYEQARAQRIIDNPGYNIDDPKEDTDENSREEDSKEESENAEELRDREPEERVQTETSDDSVVVEEQEKPVESTVEKKELESSEELNQEDDDDITDVEKWNSWVEAANQAAASPTVEERASEISFQETDPAWTEAKRKWKEENPTQNLKDWKHAYITGRIDNLPWAKYVSSGYVQNEEQSENSVWQKIQNRDNK